MTAEQSALVPAARPGRAPGPLPASLVVLLTGASLVVIAGGIRAAASLVAPVMLALVVTIGVMPVAQVCRRRGWPGWLATLLGLVAAYAVVAFLAVGLALGVIQLAATLPQYAGRATEITDELASRMDQAGLASHPVATLLGQVDLGRLTSLLTTLLTSLLSVLSSLFFLFALLFFMMAETATTDARGDRLRVAKPQLAQAFSIFVTAVQRYLLVTALFGAIVAVLDTVALWLLGVPLFLVWGLLSFVTNFIPNIGFVIGVIPPALLALLDDGWRSMVLVILVYSALNVVIQTFIQPHYVGDAVGLGVLVTFLSLGLWTFLLGPLGALLAVPMSLLVRCVLIDADPAAAWALTIVGPPPKPPPV